MLSELGDLVLRNAGALAGLAGLEGSVVRKEEGEQDESRCVGELVRGSE
jgi:hypothetical protein